MCYLEVFASLHGIIAAKGGGKGRKLNTFFYTTYFAVSSPSIVWKIYDTIDASSAKQSIQSEPKPKMSLKTKNNDSSPSLMDRDIRLPSKMLNQEKK
jgi:hypothetical protein